MAKRLLKMGPAIGGFRAGEIVELTGKRADELIASGYAVDVSSLRDRKEAEGESDKS